MSISYKGCAEILQNCHSNTGDMMSLVAPGLYAYNKTIWHWFHKWLCTYETKTAFSFSLIHDAAKDFKKILNWLRSLTDWEKYFLFSYNYENLQMHHKELTYCADSYASNIEQQTAVNQGFQKMLRSSELPGSPFQMVTFQNLRNIQWQDRLS